MIKKTFKYHTMLQRGGRFAQTVTVPSYGGRGANRHLGCKTLYDASYGEDRRGLAEKSEYRHMGEGV